MKATSAFFAVSFSLLALAQDKPNIAVNDLEAAGVSANEALVISDQLRSELLSTGKFRLIERSQMEAILKEQGFQQSGCTSDECAVEMGQLLGVRNIIAGSLGRAGSYTVIAIRLLDVATGEVIFTVTSRDKGGIDWVIEQGISEAVRKITRSFFDDEPIKKEPVAQSPPEVEENPGESAPAQMAQKPPEGSAEPPAEPSKEEKSLGIKKPEKKGNAGKVILFSSLGVVVVGGGVAVAALLSTSQDDTNPVGSGPHPNNVTIDLP